MNTVLCSSMPCNFVVEYPFTERKGVGFCKIIKFILAVVINLFSYFVTILPKALSAGFILFYYSLFRVETPIKPHDKECGVYEMCLLIDSLHNVCSWRSILLNMILHGHGYTC